MHKILFKYYVECLKFRNNQTLGDNTDILWCLHAMEYSVTLKNIISELHLLT